jgi:hypothetical protein
LAASAWQKDCKALVEWKNGTILAIVMAKESYRHGQAFPADPPQARFSPPAPSLAS